MKITNDPSIVWYECPQCAFPLPEEEVKEKRITENCPRCHEQRIADFKITHTQRL